MSLNLGKHAKTLRHRKGLSQTEAADLLGITTVHLSNIERDVSLPSFGLIDRMTAIYGVDLYVYAWCQSGDVKRLPEKVRTIAEKLKAIWTRELVK